jgi:hypothetical protein
MCAKTVDMVVIVPMEDHAHLASVKIASMRKKNRK